MYRRPRRDEWYGPSYGHHYPTAHWPISALSVPPCPSLPLCLVHRPFSHSLSLSRILFPLCLARHVSRLDSGTFRCCVVTRVMHRNFKGPGNKPARVYPARRNDAPYESDLFSISRPLSGPVVICDRV